MSMLNGCTILSLHLLARPHTFLSIIWISSTRRITPQLLRLTPQNVVVKWVTTVLLNLLSLLPCLHRLHQFIILCPPLIITLSRNLLLPPAVPSPKKKMIYMHPHSAVNNLPLSAPPTVSLLKKRMIYPRHHGTSYDCFEAL
jgi:hypothetical protein